MKFLHGRKIPILPLVAIAITAVGALLFATSPNSEVLARVFESRESFHATIDGFGIYGPVGFILLQALQVVLAPIPGEMTGAVGGMIFGTFLGTVYDTLGLILGSGIAFLLGRSIGLPIVAFMAGERQLARLDFLRRRKGRIILLIVFFIPGIPKDIATYVVSVGPTPFWEFLVLSNMARLPGTILLAASGSALIADDQGFLWIAGGITVLLIVPAVVWRHRVQEWLRRE